MALAPFIVPALPVAAISLLEVILGGIGLAAALAASFHAVVFKRESRSAALWVVLIWTVPALGAAVYVFLGINRVERKATRLRRRMVRHRTTARHPASERQLAANGAGHLTTLARLVDQAVPRPLLTGNRIEPLVGGAAAFPAMLAAIAAARESIGLASYIFDENGIGAEFIEALAAAHHRGVHVRVLIDDVDARFSRLSAARALRRRGVRVGIFNPPLVPARLHAINLRNHRKILVVDGGLGFTGGLNIDQRYWRPDEPRAAFRDLHFRLRGPVVAQLAEVFADDWHFATGDALRGERWFPAIEAGGETAARGIEAGPDESIDRLRWAIIGGLNAAQRSVQIVTPYFIPDTALISALNAAAMRGVEVNVHLPRRSDLRFVQWAAFGQLWQVLEHGCRVWQIDGPFDHSKLMVVDGAWTLLGSANWDARSLRLNFEFNVECYCARLGGQLDHWVRSHRAHARRVHLADLDARSFAVKVRDGTARLFAPFL